MLRTLDALEEGGALVAFANSSMLKSARGDNVPRLLPSAMRTPSGEKILRTGSSLKSIIWDKAERDDELRGESMRDSMRDEAPSDDGEELSEEAQDREAIERRELHTLVRKDQAALKIQAAWFMRHFNNDPAKLVEKLHLGEGGGVQQPALQIALSSMREMLPMKRSGGGGGELQQYRLNDGLAAFNDFGVEIAMYMRFMTYAGRLVWLVVLLNLSNIVSNLEGGNSSDLLAKNALSNSDCLGNAYGVVEGLTSALFVYFVFFMRRSLLQCTKEIREKVRDNELVTSANFTALVTNCPPSINTQEAIEHLKRRFALFGEIFHVGVALNNRELIVAMKRRSELLSSVQVPHMTSHKPTRTSPRRQACPSGAAFVGCWLCYMLACCHDDAC